MKIVSYNVNGLRPRISQFGSLRNLLNSFDADILCFQETKLRRQELTADLVTVDGYESFFSCTRTSQKGRTAYSGVITFCRVKSAFSSNEAALPLAAEEGFTGLMSNSQTSQDKLPFFMEHLEDFSKDELLNVDSEGRCIVTDHGHFDWSLSYIKGGEYLLLGISILHHLQLIGVTRDLILTIMSLEDGSNRC